MNLKTLILTEESLPIVNTAVNSNVKNKHDAEDLTCAHYESIGFTALPSIIHTQSNNGKFIGGNPIPWSVLAVTDSYSDVFSSVSSKIWPKSARFNWDYFGMLDYLNYDFVGEATNFYKKLDKKVKITTWKGRALTRTFDDIRKAGKETVVSNGTNYIVDITYSELFDLALSTFGKKKLNFLSKITHFISGSPDLFVYNKNGNWMFVEVKTGSDILRDNQKLWAWAVKSTKIGQYKVVRVGQTKAPKSYEINLDNFLEEKQKEIAKTVLLNGLDSNVEKAVIEKLANCFIEKYFSSHKKFKQYVFFTSFAEQQWKNRKKFVEERQKEFPFLKSQPLEESSHYGELFVDGEFNESTKKLIMKYRTTWCKENLSDVNWDLIGIKKDTIYPSGEKPFLSQTEKLNSSERISNLLFSEFCTNYGKYHLVSEIVEEY